MMRGLVLLLVFAALAAWAASPTLERLPNGLRVVVQPTTASQVVSIEALVRFSALDEGVAEAGLRQVLVAAMQQGSAAVSGQTLRQTLTLNGGSLEGRVHQDALEFTLTVPATATHLGLSALAEVLCRPALTDSGITNAILQTRSQVYGNFNGSLSVAGWLSQQLVYRNHPYLTRGAGSDAALALLTPERVREAYARYVTPGSVVLAVVGRCGEKEVRGQVNGLFGAWTGTPPPPTMLTAPPALDASRLELREVPVKTACVMLTFPVCGVTHPDFLPLRVVDALLGGGTGARLFRSVRAQRNLAYDVATTLPAQLAGSHFALYAQTGAPYIDEVKRAITDEIIRLQTERVSDEELKRAKAYLKGRYLLSHQYSALQAFDLAWNELIGLGVPFNAAFPARVDAVTADDIQRVSRDYFTHYYLVVVLPQLQGVENSSGKRFNPRITRGQHP
jgi:zinc protease